MLLRFLVLVPWKMRSLEVHSCKYCSTGLIQVQPHEALNFRETYTLPTYVRGWELCFPIFFSYSQADIRVKR